MSVIEQVLLSEKHLALRGPRYLLDSVLAGAGSLLVTGLIVTFQLYPRIPNISIVYLLIVLALATTRGRYAALLAALVAFLSFNFFVVPPLHTFVLYRIEEWIALFVFFITALLTGQLAVALRERAEQASRRKRETHLLYDLVRVTNREEAPTRQLEAIVRASVDVLATFGVEECTLLQPDSMGILQVQASATRLAKPIILSADEQVSAAWVLTHGRTMTLYEENTPVSSASANGGQREAGLPPIL